MFDSTQEEQSFDFFRSRSVRELTELFHVDETFWNLCVLQMSMTQPAVRYAVAALGAMHRKYADGDAPAVPDDASDSQTRFALEQCNRSIKTLVERKDAEARGEKVATLVACILYTCLASIQGHQSQSIMHLRNGMKLLDNLAPPKTLESNSMTHYDTQFQSFLTTLSSLEVQARSLMCEEDLPAWPTRMRIRASSSADHQKFANLSEARDFFENILSDFQCFVIERDQNQEWLRAPGNSPCRSSMDEYKLLVKKHSSGAEALEDFISSQHKLGERDEKLILMLRLHMCVVELYLKVYILSTEYGELAWDRLEHYFVQLVTLVRQILGCTEQNLAEVLRSPAEVLGNGPGCSQNGGRINVPFSKVPLAASILKDGHYQSHRPVFAFSQGVLGALSTTAILSRSPSLRREAIALLLLYPRREGLWDSYTAGRLAWVSMCLEEELTYDLRSDEGHSKEFRIKGASDVPLECRVRLVHMKYIASRVGEVRFSTMKDLEAGKKGNIVKILEW